MKITDINNPIIKILSDNDMRKVDRDSIRLCDEGWFRVGGMVKIRHEWTQVLVRERDLCQIIKDGLPAELVTRKPGRPRNPTLGDKALKTITED